MKISIKIQDENKDAILAEAMGSISRAASGEAQWEKDRTYGYHEAECDVSVKDILPVFRALTAKYPKLDIFALDCEEIRDEDRGAQWWRTTKITTEHRPDGTTELNIDSGTYWA
ncbi:MAG: hypothetical protein NC319_07345 [Butyricicoccus sp.]|nr:hypothetical protein [Butyricicoccus sp.]